MRSVVESDSRVKVRGVNGKPYLCLVCPDGSEKCADRLDRHPDDVRALMESVRRPRGKGGQDGSMASVQAQTPAQQLVSARVEGGRVVVEREAELKTIWDIERINLDPRVTCRVALLSPLLPSSGSLLSLLVSLLSLLVLVVLLL